MFNQNEINVIDKSIEAFIKDNKRYPTLEQLTKVKDVGFFFEIIKNDKNLIQQYNKYLLINLEKRILAKNSVKMRKEFAESYKKNKKLFEEFFILNFDRENLHTNDFHEKWKEIQEIIQDVTVRVVWKMEGWNSKYGVFSSSVNDKFIAYIKEFFPFYDSIWVTIRKLKK